MAKKKICVFTVRQLAPTLNFFMALLVENNYLNTLFLPSFWCLRDHYFDNVTLQVKKCILDANQHQFSYKK